MLRLNLVLGNQTTQWQVARSVEGFYACQLNKNEEHFLVQAFAVTNTSSMARVLFLGGGTLACTYTPSKILQFHFSRLWLKTRKIRHPF